MFSKTCIVLIGIIVGALMLFGGIIGVIFTSINISDGCGEYKRECFAVWPRNPDGSENHNSCYIGIANTTYGCDSDSSGDIILCQSKINKTFTCYTKEYTDNEDVCPPAIVCFNGRLSAYQDLLIADIIIAVLIVLLLMMYYYIT